MRSGLLFAAAALAACQDASIKRLNTAPTVDSVTLSPATVYTNDTITAAVTTSDEDGDAVTVTYAWYVNGDLVGETGSTLSGATYFNKDDLVHVVATPSDGSTTGVPRTSGSITILNTAPTGPAVSISPEAPASTEDDLICIIEAPSTDDDGDPVAYTIEWTVDGDAFTDTLTTDRPGDTVSVEDTNGDEAWTCTVTPNDGDADGPAGSATVTIEDCFEGWASSSSVADADYSFIGESWDDNAGYSVASAGDVDGDGLDDLLVGADGNDDGGSDSGKAYLILGASLGSSSTIDLSAADYSFVGENAGDRAGNWVSSAGDVDGDGLDDFLVSAYISGGDQKGKVYLILGASLGSSSSIDLSAADYSFVGETAMDQAGISASSAGDVDGDGLDDLLVGAYGNNDEGPNAGKVYLVLGASLGSSSSIDLSAADYSFVGENDWDNAGRSVSSAGDVDGDGLDDLLVGATHNDDGDNASGKAYLILGASLGSSSTIDLSAADYSFVGENARDWAGQTVSSAGDVDGDGLDDILVGTSNNDEGGDGSGSAGKSYLILGASLGSDSTIDLSAADYSFVGEHGLDHAGSSVSSAGDVDGDGLADLLVGAWGNNDGGENSGKAYLIPGASLGSDSTIELSAVDYRFVGGYSGDYAGRSVSSAGDMNGDGLADLLVGANGAEPGGRTYLFLTPNACNTPTEL